MANQIILTTDSKIGEILAHEESAAVFDKFLPGMRGTLEAQPAAMGLSVKKMISYMGGKIPETVIPAMDAALAELTIYSEEVPFSDETPCVSGGLERVTPETKDAIYPGKPWFDTEGKRIQAHGGAVLYEDGTYYWYGENKDRTDGKNGIWTWGIRAYASKDLYNWEDLGLIIKPEFEDETSNLYPTMRVDRPHILKNPVTGKYVCWIKLSGDEACFLILEADKFLGPYEIVASDFRPDGHNIGDFDIIRVDEKAYLFVDADHNGVIGYELTTDYRTIDHEISRQYENIQPPFTREGITLFQAKDQYYMLTSGMSGYVPNKSDSAVAKSITDSFASIGNPHRNDDTNSSFNSQISQVFKVEGKENLYVAIADRWVPEFMLDARLSSVMERAIACRYEPDKYQVTEDEMKAFMNSPMLTSANTSISDYVWLPVIVDEEGAHIDWYDSWKVEDFD